MKTKYPEFKYIKQRMVRNNKIYYHHYTLYYSSIEEARHHVEEAVKRDKVPRYLEDTLEYKRYALMDLLNK